MAYYILEEYHILKEYDIPQVYNRPKVVLLPVNRSKYYLYWELTNELIDKSNLTLVNEIYFYIVDENGTTLEKHRCHALVGDYFIKNDFNNSTIKVLIGFDRDDKFIKIIESNSIKIFNSKIKYSEEDAQIYLKKERGFTEIISSSLEHFNLGMSSTSYVEEIKRLEEFTKTSQNSLSSHNLGRK